MFIITDDDDKRNCIEWYLLKSTHYLDTAARDSIKFKPFRSMNGSIDCLTCIFSLSAIMQTVLSSTCWRSVIQLDAPSKKRLHYIKVNRGLTICLYSPLSYHKYLYCFSVMQGQNLKLHNVLHCFNVGWGVWNRQVALYTRTAVTQIWKTAEVNWSSRDSRLW